MGGNESLQRLLIEVDRTVVSADTSTGSRPVTKYVIQNPDGRQTEYVAGPTDLSLPHGIPLGTVLQKKRWRFSLQRVGCPAVSLVRPPLNAVSLAGANLDQCGYSNDLMVASRRSRIPMCDQGRCSGP